MLIIGCGNRDRMDDGAGVLVAERLRSLGVPADILSGEALSLIEAWSSTNDAIIVDTVVTGRPIGTVRVWDSRRLLSFGSPPLSSHGLGVAEAIELARTLGRLPKRLRVYGIEGKRFGFGSNLSTEMALAVEQTARAIKLIYQNTTEGCIQPEREVTYAD